MKPALACVTVAEAALILAGCGEVAPKADASAQLACGHFRKVLTEIADRTVTTGEAQGRIQEVDDNASRSKNVGVRDNARSLLTASMTDEATGLYFATGAWISAATKLVAACKAVGV